MRDRARMLHAATHGLSKNRKSALSQCISVPDIAASAVRFYSDLIAHPKVTRVVALSGGFSQSDADARLARNPGLVASFSRALVEGLTAQQSDAEFDEALAASVNAIYAASVTK
jgi:fructose-bisphosphate aldolase class I